MNQWRKFQFFDERVPETALPDDLRRSISCAAGGRGSVSLGTSEGLVHVTDRSLRVKLSFLAHTGPVLCICQLKQRNIIVTVGEEAPQGAPPSSGPVAQSQVPQASTCLKLWDLDKRDAHDTPICLRSFDVFSLRFPHAKVTTMAVAESPPFNLLIAIGLESGAIDLLRADSKHISRVRLPPDPDLAASSLAPSLLPVTGLGFRADAASGMQLFAVSQGSVSIFPLSSVSSASMPVRQLVAPLGAPLGCITMSIGQDLVVARPEAFYFYNDEGPGPCYAMECGKSAVGWFREYLVCVHADPRKGDRTLVAVYDLRSKLMVHSGVVLGEVQHLVCEGGAILLLLKEGAPLVLLEKDMQSKLQALFKKSLYGLALSLVQASSVDESVVTEVVRKYGDHLYEMRDFEGAVAQYVRTIGQLEPSYVIQKFLSAQRIQNLTLYLEELHRARAAGPDHTILLLNCYTRVKDVSKLDAFVRGQMFPGQQGEEEPRPTPAPSPSTGTSSSASTPTPTEGQRHRLSVSSSTSSLQGVAEGEAPNASTDATTSAAPAALPAAGTAGGPAGPVSSSGGGVGGREGGGAAAGAPWGSSQSAAAADALKVSLPKVRVKEPVESRQALPFDAETAIKLCQTAGCHEQAAYIARRAGLHAAVLSITLDSLGRFQEGLQYLSQLPLELKLSALKQYGHVLVAHCPEDVTALLLELCVATPGREGGGARGDSPMAAGADRKIIKEIKVSEGRNASPTNQGGGRPPGRPPIQVKLVPILGGSPKHAQRVASVATAVSPMEFAELYVDQPAALISLLEKFSERVHESPWHREVLNALLELYLSYEVVAPAAAASASTGGGAEEEDGAVERDPARACARTDPEAWAMQKMRVKEDKDRLSLEALDAAAAAVGAMGPPGSGSSSGARSAGFIPATPKLFGLPGSGSVSASLATPGGGGAGSSGAAPEFEERSRLWYLAKAGKLLKAGWPQQGGTPRYDPEQAVLSCQMHGFRDGLLFLYERLKMFKEVIASYMKEGDLKGLIACCKKLGDPQRGGDPSLWADVLSFFGEQESACEAEVREVLEVVERDSLLPPLVVLQTLARNRAITVGVVRGYVARQLQRDTAAIEEDRRAIERYQEETAKYRAELHDLETSARVFQVNKCTACSSPLDLPSVHFLCMHSFHLRCMGDNESECPVCAPANRTVLEMRRSLEQSANDQDRFFQELHDAKDGFSVIAEYFGRNIMNPKAQEHAEGWSKPLHRKSASYVQSGES